MSDWQEIEAERTNAHTTSPNKKKKNSMKIGGLLKLKSPNIANFFTQKKNAKNKQ